jgi:hypothetical protein
MEISLIGFLVCAGLFLVGLAMRAPVIVPLFASLPFGATAAINLPAIGGSSPLIYTMFIAWLLVAVLARRHFLRELGIIFSRYPASFVIVGLMAYACIGAYLFPRLFAGATYALVTVRVPGGAGRVVEMPLVPSGGNITQTGYLVLGSLTFFGLCILLLKRERLAAMRAGFMVWTVVHAGLGLIDWTGKLVGIGDILEPIRTANYVMLTDAEHGGFARVVGGYSEASAFGGVTVACLAYAFTDWKNSGSRLMLVLSAVLAVLLVMSTSSTAYVALAVILVPVGFSVARSFLTGRVLKSDIVLVTAAIIGAAAILCLYVMDNRIFDPFVTLFDATILNKATSGSAVERSHWNEVSFQSFLDTYFLGIGVGSSRASSWPVAVVSQLGLFGTVLTGMLLLYLMPVACKGRDPSEVEIVALHQGARAAALCGLVTGSIASGTADPGVMFFMVLAVVTSCRYHLRSSRIRTQPYPPPILDAGMGRVPS